MYKAIQIADYILSKCTKESSPISNLQLQKIMYYIQRDFLQNTPEALFEEDFEAWQFGPVVPEVYYKYCGFGGMKIRIQEATSYSNDEAIFSKIDTIVESKRKENPWTLVEDTHQPQKAWAYVYKNGAGNHQIISKELIKTRG